MYNLFVHVNQLINQPSNPLFNYVKKLIEITQSSGS